MYIRYLKQAFILLLLTVMVGVSGVAIVSRARGGNLLSVQTGSMEPAFPAGSLVSVNRVPVADLRLGDVITFISPTDRNQTITHRIVQLPMPKNGQKFITKGDANPMADVPISAAQIVGKVIFSVPYLGRVVDAVRHPIGLAFIIYLPALVVVWGELRRLTTYYKSQSVYRAATRQRGRPLVVQASKFTPLVLAVTLAVPLLVIAQARAALWSAPSRLVGSSVSATRSPVVLPPPAAPPPPPPGPSTCPAPAASSSNTHAQTHRSNSSVFVHNSSTQTATSGAAQNTPGSASSGAASNCNNTGISVSITNN